MGILGPAFLSSLPDTLTNMQAVVFKGVKEVAVEQRPKPTIQDPQEVIVKVHHTALCGRWVEEGTLHEAKHLPNLNTASYTSTVATRPPEPGSSWAMSLPAPSQK